VLFDLNNNYVVDESDSFFVKGTTDEIVFTSRRKVTTIIY